MKTFGGVPSGLEDNTYITVEVTNEGNRKTTLTRLVGFHYKSIFQKFRKKQDKSFIANPALSQSLPYVLEAGERWLGGIIQNKELEEMSKNGYLFCGVHYSSRKKPVVQRVVINDHQ